MHPGDILLWAGFAVAVLAMALTILRLFLVHKMDTRITWILSLVSFLLVSSSFILLVQGFLTSDMTIEYVHSYSAKDLEWFYKLTGVWAGGKGSIILWTFMTSLLVFLQVTVWNLRDKEKRSSEEFQAWLFLVETGIVAALVFMTLQVEVFAPTPDWLLALIPDGRGLNPLLETPLMTIHPPMVFTAYAFTSILFAACIALLATADRKWTFDAQTYGRMSWLFMTLGIIIGAIWAYTVLGWGGYWGWDPVETANLLPWISLTAFLHAAFMNRRKGSYQYMAPLLGIVSFALVLFTTFETRSGFVESVHAFAGGGPPGILDPAEKLIFVLGDAPESAFFLSLMLFSLLVGAIFFLWRALAADRRRRSSAIFGYAYILLYAALLIPVAADVRWFLSGFFEVSRALGVGNLLLGVSLALFLLLGAPFIWVVMTSEASEERGKRPILSSDSWMTITVLILSVWFLATFLLMMQGIDGLEPQSFESRLPLILIPLGAVMILCLSWGHVTPGFSFYVVGLIVAATVFGFALFSNRDFFVYIPVSLGIAATAGYKIAKVSARTGTARNLKLAGLFLIFAAILGMVMWGSGPSRIWLGPLSLQTNLPMLFAGLLASIVTFVAGISTLRGGDLRLALLGGLLGILSIGFVAGLVLSAIALTLIIIESRNPSQTSQAGGLRRSLVKAGAHLVHVGAALLIIGYATSTFLPTTYGNERLDLGGEPVTAEGYQFEITDSAGYDRDQNLRYNTVEVIVQVSDSGGEVAALALRMVWLEAQQHYTSEVRVHSDHLMDIYFVVTNFHTLADGDVRVGQTRIVNQTVNEKFSSAFVDSITFNVQFLPLVGLVWSGAWTMSIGVVMRIASDRWLVKEKKPAEERTPRPDKEYEEMLERELREMGDV